MTVFLKPAGLILQWQCNEGVHGSVDVEVNVGYQAIDDNHGQAAKRHCPHRMSAGLPRIKETVQSTKGYRTAINGLPSMYQNPYISSKAVRL